MITISYALPSPLPVPTWSSSFEKQHLFNQITATPCSCRRSHSIPHLVTADPAFGVIESDILQGMNGLVVRSKTPKSRFVGAAGPMSAFERITDSSQTSRQVRKVPCVDGSWLARAFFTYAALVGAAMCSACRCGSHDRWPLCPPRIRSRSKTRIGECDGTSGLSRSLDRPALHYVLFASQPSHHAGCPARSRLRRKCDGLLVTLALGHHAQAMRAILSASAMAATFVGRRPSNAVSQGRCLVPWILA